MDRISTRGLKSLPSVDDLKRICQSVATLDAIMMPDWEYRFYSIDAKWGEDEMLASMRNGSGDSYSVLFTSDGAIIKGFAHESLMARHAADVGRVWPGVLDQVPPEFAQVLTEPAFVPEETSFCIWRRNEDLSWETGTIEFPEGADPDGSEDLLFVLDGDPETYEKWGSGYYERSIPLDAVREVYEHRPLTQQLISRLNPDRLIDDLREDLKEIGYP